MNLNFDHFSSMIYGNQTLINHIIFHSSITVNLDEVIRREMLEKMTLVHSWKRGQKTSFLFLEFGVQTKNTFFQIIDFAVVNKIIFDFPNVIENQRWVEEEIFFVFLVNR